MMACGGNGPTEPPALQAAGRYDMQTFNGHGLPVPVSQTSDLLGGGITLNEDGTCLARAALRGGADGYQPAFAVETPCTYFGRGAALTITYGEFSSAGGVLEGATLTLFSGTNTVVFQRNDIVDLTTTRAGS